MNETDLYHPIKTYFELQGYSVKGEIKKCGILAINQFDLTQYQ